MSEDNNQLLKSCHICVSVCVYKDDDDDDESCVCVVVTACTACWTGREWDVGV